MGKVEGISDAESHLDQEGRISAVEVNESPAPVTIVRAVSERCVAIRREAARSALARGQEPRQESKDRERADDQT